MKILFLHGLESAPGGKKPKFLESLGHEVLNPALLKEDFEASVQIAQKVFDEESPDLVVGSSRGGAVAMALESNGVKTVLIAPAYKKYQIDPTHVTRSGERVVLHSILDDVISIDDSAHLVKNYGYYLHVCGGDHRMSDPDALRMLEEVIGVEQA